MFKHNNSELLQVKHYTRSIIVSEAVFFCIFLPDYLPIRLQFIGCGIVRPRGPMCRYAWTSINDYLFILFSLTRCLTINREQHSPPQVYNKSDETRRDHFAALSFALNSKRIAFNIHQTSVDNTQLHPRHSWKPVEWLSSVNSDMKL